MTHPRAARRAGFTLVELVVVIAIIGVLMAMLLPALSSAIDAAARARTRTEISQLDVAIAAAKRDLSLSGTELPYLPSDIVLCDTWSDYAVTSIPTGQGWDTRVTLANLATSKAFLQKVFGKNIGLSSSGTLTLDWNGNGNSSGTTPDKPVLLTGEQALVFWLGGIPQKDASGTRGDCTGFASNPSNPTLAAGSAQSGARKGPYFEFKSAQLVVGSNGFLSYMDPYRSRDSGGNPVPYVYYSSDGNGNYSAASVPSGGPFPYKNPLGKFINPRTYQLISAGKDGVFGNTTAPGANWDPTVGWPPSSADTAARDDLANFSPNALGKPAS